MKSIVTITINPAIDKSTIVDHIVPNHKLRCSDTKFEPGGGGLNVSRVIKRLGGESLAIFPVGGHTGKLLQELLDKEGIKQDPVEIKNWTRENFMAVDSSSNQQFRFLMSGPETSIEEGQLLLDKLTNLAEKPDYIVASGSLPPGLPDNFFVKIAKIAQKMNSKFILDTSGKGLQMAALEKVYLLKPNLSELSKMAGVESLKTEMIEEAARQIIDKGNCEMLAVSLGPAGALFVSKDYTELIPAPPVHSKSTVGAGDSMLAGMVFSLAAGKSLQEVIRYGVACGSATTMHSGTELCLKNDVDKLYKWIRKN